MSVHQLVSYRFTLALAFVACFAATPAFSAEALPSFQLIAKDGRFNPETIEVPAGKKFKLVVRNEGPGAEEFESHELKREKVIPEGKTAEINIGPLKPGTYSFFGEFHPKTANGKIVAK